MNDGGGGNELGNVLVRPLGEGLLHLLQDVQPPRLGLRQCAPQQRRRETVALDVQLERRDACSIRFDSIRCHNGRQKIKINKIIFTTIEKKKKKKTKKSREDEKEQTSGALKRNKYQVSLLYISRYCCWTRCKAVHALHAQTEQTSRALKDNTRCVHIYKHQVQGTTVHGMRQLTSSMEHTVRTRGNLKEAGGGGVS